MGFLWSCPGRIKLFFLSEDEVSLNVGTNYIDWNLIDVIVFKIVTTNISI